MTAARRICTMLALAAGLASANPAAARTDRVVWTTWLRAGPGVQFVVTGELDRDQLVEVAGCDQDWCRAVVDGRTGYVRADMLSKQPPVPLSGSTQPCFESRRAGYAGGETYRYCPQ